MFQNQAFAKISVAKTFIFLSLFAKISVAKNIVAIINVFRVHYNLLYCLNIFLGLLLSLNRFCALVWRAKRQLNEFYVKFRHLATISFYHPKNYVRTRGREGSMILLHIVIFTFRGRGYFIDQLRNGRTRF